MSSYSSWVSVPSVSIWSYISCCCFSISASNSIWVLRSELMAGVGDSAASSGMPSWPLRSAMVRASSSFCARSSCTFALSSSTDIPSKSAISLRPDTRERRLSGRGTKAPALRGLAVGPRSRSRPGRGLAPDYTGHLTRPDRPRIARNASPEWELRVLRWLRLSSVTSVMADESIAKLELAPHISG